MNVPEPGERDGEEEGETVGQNFGGVLECPACRRAPVCHLVRLTPETHEEIEREVDRGEFDGQHWMSDEEEAE